MSSTAQETPTKDTDKNNGKWWHQLTKGNIVKGTEWNDLEYDKRMKNLKAALEKTFPKSTDFNKETSKGLFSLWGPINRDLVWVTRLQKYLYATKECKDPTQMRNEFYRKWALHIKQNSNWDDLTQTNRYASTSASLAPTIGASRYDDDSSIVQSVESADAGALTDDEDNNDMDRASKEIFTLAIDSGRDTIPTHPWKRGCLKISVPDTSRHTFLPMMFFKPHTVQIFDDYINFDHGSFLKCLIERQITATQADPTFMYYNMCDGTDVDLLEKNNFHAAMADWALRPQRSTSGLEYMVTVLTKIPCSVAVPVPLAASSVAPTPFLSCKRSSGDVGHDGSDYGIPSPTKKRSLARRRSTKPVSPGSYHSPVIEESEHEGDNTDKATDQGQSSDTDANQIDKANTGSRGAREDRNTTPKASARDNSQDVETIPRPTRAGSGKDHIAATDSSQMQQKVTEATIGPAGDLIITDKDIDMTDAQIVSGQDNIDDSTQRGTTPQQPDDGGAHDKAGEHDVVLSHPTLGRTYTKEQKREAVFALPFQWQERKVQQDCVRFTAQQFQDEEYVAQMCEFSESSDEINVLSLEKFAIGENQSAKNTVAVLDGDDNDDDDDAGTTTDDLPDRSRALEHFTAPNFYDFVKFFRLDVTETPFHSRTKFNFPGISRTPFLHQLFGAFVLLRFMMDLGVAVNGDRPGLGKTTSRELVYIMWLHLDNMRRDIDVDRLQAEEATAAGKTYQARHLSRKAINGMCPTGHGRIYQCPCEPGAAIEFDMVKPFEGYRLDLCAKSQLVMPSMVEAYNMYHKTPTGTWHDDYENVGIGGAGRLWYRAFHTDELKNADSKIRDSAKLQQDDFEKIKPTFLRDDLEPDEDGLLDMAEYVPDKVGSTINYDLFREGSWTYNAPDTAKNFTIATTKHFYLSTEHNYSRKLWKPRRELRRMQEPQYRKLRRPAPVNLKRDEHHAAKPGMLCVDEYHTLRTDADNVMSAISSRFSSNGWGSSVSASSSDKKFYENEFWADILEIPVTRILLMSGTPLSGGVAEAIQKAATMAEGEAQTFANDDWADHAHPHHNLSHNKLAKVKKELTAIERTIAKNFKESLVTSSKAGSKQSVRQQVPQQSRRQLAKLNKYISECLKKCMIQRDAESTMFGQRLGIPVNIKEVYVEPDDALLSIINQPAFNKRTDIQAEVNKVKDDEDAPSHGTIMTKVLMNDASTRIAGVMPGHAAARAAWAVTQAQELDRMMGPDDDNGPVVKWPKVLEGRFWGSLNAEERKVATTLTWHNGEMEAKGMNSTWPARPHKFFRIHYKGLLGMEFSKKGRAQQLQKDAMPRTKFEQFYKWVHETWHMTDPYGRPACGFVASLSTFELETLRTAACEEFGNRNSQWYIAEHIAREMFAIYTRNWVTKRASAVSYIIGEGVEAFGNEYLGVQARIDQHPFLNEEEWKSMARRPRFLFGSGVLAEGISAPRFYRMAMLEPFHQKAKITQMSCRTQRINSEHQSDIAVWVTRGGFYDNLALGVYKGPEEASEELDMVERAFMEEAV